MTASSVDSGDWLYATLRAVQAAMVETAEPSAFSTALVEQVAAVDEHALVWVGRVTAADKVRVYAAATGAGSLGVAPTCPDATESPSRRAVKTDRVQVHTTLDDNSEYDAFADHVDATPTAGLTIPIGDGRVLVIYTSADMRVAESPSDGGDPSFREQVEELGAAVELGYRSFERMRELTRERDRLETVRSVVSHDLGNPLNVAAGRLSLAADECESEHLAHVESGLTQIETLADETLQFVQMSRRVESREPVSLAAYARSCWSSADSSRGSLDVTDSPVEGDPERFRRLLTELFENALVHSDGPVTVTVGTLSDRAGFFVEDDGPGVPEDEQAYVLDRGYSTLPDREGNGLAIVAAIVDAHDWTFELHHETPGTRVEVGTERW